MSSLIDRCHDDEVDALRREGEGNGVSPYDHITDEDEGVAVRIAVIVFWIFLGLLTIFTRTTR